MDIKPVQPTGTFAVSSSNEEEKKRENRQGKNKKTVAPKQAVDSEQQGEASTIANQPVDTEKMLELLAQRSQRQAAVVPHYVPKASVTPIPAPKVKLGKAF